MLYFLSLFGWPFIFKRDSVNFIRFQAADGFNSWLVLVVLPSSTKTELVFRLSNGSDDKKKPREPKQAEASE